MNQHMVAPRALPRSMHHLDFLMLDTTPAACLPSTTDIQQSICYPSEYYTNIKPIIDMHFTPAISQSPNPLQLYHHSTWRKPQALPTPSSTHLPLLSSVSMSSTHVT